LYLAGWKQRGGYCASAVELKKCRRTGRQERLFFYWAPPGRAACTAPASSAPQGKGGAVPASASCPEGASCCALPRIERGRRLGRHVYRGSAIRVGGRAKQKNSSIP